MAKFNTVDSASLRELCIKNNWFTGGTCEQYDKLFQVNRDCENFSFSDVALIVWLCSNEELESIKEKLRKAVEQRED